MATKQEIVASINDGIARVDATFGGLSDEQLQQKVHEADGGWTAKQILAHLAGRQGSYDAIVAMAQGDAPPFTSGVDDWNQQAVDQRIDNSAEALLTEFQQVHETLIATVRDLDEDLLATTIAMPRGEMTLSDILAGSGGRHSISHSAEVEAALGLSAPGE